MTPIAYIVVHGGAGIHGVNHEKEVKRALRTACSEALSSSFDLNMSMEKGPFASTSLKIVEQAICVLEDNEHLNAGYGSNLTLDGTVECDASVIAHQPGRHAPLFGSVGAVSGIKNPIKLAKSILDYSRMPEKLGRIPPLTLVSSGAHKFALGRVDTVPEEALIAPTAYAQWQKWKGRLNAADDAASVHPATDAEDDRLHDDSPMQDTVGAIAFHSGVMAAGVSSGGLLLKHPGRIGEAAVFGAGCWANHVLACSVSGTGEHIVRTDLARGIGEALKGRRHRASEDEQQQDADAHADPHDVLNRLLVEFWNACGEQGEECPAVGVILLTAEQNEADSEGEPIVRLWCAFTTASMAVAYASTVNPKPKATIFRHPNPQYHSDRSGSKPQIFITSLSL